MDFGSLLFKFGGRINRAKFWLAVLIYFVISSALAAASYLAAPGMAFAAAAGMINIVVFISGLAVAIKRLHDRNKSGWYLLLFYVAPTILIVASVAVTISDDGSGLLGTVLALASIIISIWAFVELGCLRGTIGANQYGPDPLSPEVLTPPVHTR